MPAPTIFWFRRDLRLYDNPALEAAAEAGPVVAVFINDESLRGPSGANRLAFLAETLRWLTQATDRNLVVRSGPPLEVLFELATEVGAQAVFATGDHGPYGRRRDMNVAEGLHSKQIAGHFLSSNYAVAPNSVFSGAGTPYKVFTPFFRAWKANGWPAPSAFANVEWVTGIRSESVPPSSADAQDLPHPGEEAALHAAEDFMENRLMDYPEARNQPGIHGTSGLSPYLKWGNIHPRQLLAMLGTDPASEVFRSEIAWREFYADVIYHRPDSARDPLIPKMAMIEVDTGANAEARFGKWCEGQTGFPIVDAGMRQLRSQAWMHNRVRMITASFLVKDLHLPWQWGARYFMEHLVDGDLASNSHGWQWVAGTGTDASPYYRVFNPVAQSRKFDPAGLYLRRWVPEIAHLADKEIHEPHLATAGRPRDYPPPMVDHREERVEALARLEASKRIYENI